MKKIILFSAIALLVLAMASCKKEESNNLPVDFKFTLLDTLGNEKTVFNQGENIIFSFEITNKTSQDVHIGNFFPNDNFFRVYQTNTNEGTLDYGIPYEAVILVGYFSIFKNDILKIEYPWEGGVFWNEKYPILSNENNNLDLPIGDYYTEFSQSFEISEIGKEHYFTEEKHFKINFTIK